MIAGLISRFKALWMTALAVILVVFGAYCWGGRAAKRAVEIKAQRDENKRLQHTVDMKNEAVNVVRSKDDDTIARELNDKWMRD